MNSGKKGVRKMREKSQVDDIDRSIYDIRDEEKDAYRMKEGLTQIIINIEAQKEEPGEYKILNRAIFYICRIVSSQKGRDFVNSEYDNMKRVYSIWICMNMKEHSLSHIHLKEEQIIGSHKWKGDLNLLNIIMIGIAKNLPEKEEKYELHRLLSALLSSDLEVKD